MRRLLLIGLALVLVAGCKKATNKVVPNDNASGGSGGAVQAVRGAVIRTVNQNEMHNLRIYMENASGASGRMPTVDEIKKAVQRDAPTISKLLQSGAIVLTGTRTRDGVWAYTADPQPTDHLVLTSNGIERMPAQTLRERLQ